VLEKASQARLFSFFEGLSHDEMTAKITEVEDLAKGFDKTSEAAMDAKFMLRHMRRIRMERLLSSKRVVQ